MMNVPDPVSSSFTDSISSELHRRMEAEEINSLHNNNNQQSVHSNLNNSNGSYTAPMNINKSMLEISERRGSNAGSVSSSHYLNEEDSIYSSGGDSSDDGNDKATPLPKLQMFVISVLLFSEPLTSTILFPFIYSMLRDFHLSDDEKEIGSYAGWITSVFFIAQFCTAMIWGKISDRFGRRPVLLTGLIGNTVSSCLFGLSTNIWWAIGSRALCGVMNGNSGVARSAVSEITDNTNKAKAFSIFSIMWNTGMIGPALGGYLSKPAENFPTIFGNCQFLKDYPYFLPCFISACGSMIGFVIGCFFLKESNPNVIAHRKWNKDQSERTALLGNEAGRAGNNNDDEYSNTKTIPKSGSLRNVTKASIIVIINYSLYGFHAMVFDEILPLYFTAPVYAGGLGVSLPEFAGLLSFLGISQLIFQFGVYPRMTRQFDVLVLCRVALFIFIPVYIIFPELSVYREWALSQLLDGTTNWTFRFGYAFVLILRFFASCVSFTGLTIMVSTSATSEVLGTVNGISQSCLSLVRALAPTLGGTLWSYSLKDGNSFPFDHHFVYYLIGIMAGISFIFSFLIPNSVALGGKSK
ncbi:hypothetical protein HPULCUR_003547 [Helicostylum pulchrum]|uniref:Major facilitator superfamily (MFS) profile domain-containing protein n=1 Tax=Helicostylum pulchrum TaxID=562976 RepID=A0ABP9XTQ1_9FUNG